MIIFPATLFGIFVAGLCWIIIKNQGTRRLLASRLSEIPIHLSFPYTLGEQSSPNSKNEPITLDDSYKNKMVRKLFLAGLRTQGYVRFFRLLRKLGLMLPAGFITIYLLTGSLTFKNFFFAIMAGVVVTFYTHIVIGLQKRERQRKITRALPQFLDLLVVCIEAGLSFTAALARVLQELDPKEPLTKELKLMHHEFLSGISLVQACERLAHRCETHDLSIVLSAIVQSEQMGSALADALRVQASELRDKHRQRMREKAHKIPVRLLFPALLIFTTLFMITLGPTLYKVKGLLLQSAPQGKFSISARGVSK